uniref:Uncharacterized protein n=1 Tax=Avena sativa TaxID=4498 RepID=A0ACD5TQR6_AVESA
MISPHGAYPDWALLTKTARFSDEGNETTAECNTPEGQPVAVTFWLSDPPAVSHFTLHCPGLDASDTPPYVICADGAFVLFRVTLVDSSLHHFVYSAAGAGENPSLHLLPNPDPNVASFRTQEKFGILPCGDDHYAVAFLDWDWPRDSNPKTQYHACVFSSETNAWRRSKVAPLRLPESDKALFYTFAHGSYYKQITVGDSAVGWVDLTCGILLACNLFDETPVMRFIPFPASRACITYQDGDPYYARDVVCSGDLIRFVETDFDEPADRRTNNGQGRRAATWNMKIDWDYWRRRCTVDVGDVSVDQSYSALLPELLDEETGELKLKKLDLMFPTLSVRNDNLLYMMTKVDQTDDTAWVIVLDMRRAVVEALVPVATMPTDTVTPYCSCAFPRYYPADDTVETDDGSQDNDPMKGYRDWRQDWCEQSLESWDFSEVEDEHEREDPAKKEEGDDDEEDLVKSQEEGEHDDDGDEAPVITEVEECQAMKTFCQKTNAGADMGNPMDNQDKSHERRQGGFDPEDNKHQQKKKKRRKRTRSSRRKKKKQAQAEVPDAVAELLDLLLFVWCILIAIISIKAFPV